MKYKQLPSDRKRKENKATVQPLKKHDSASTLANRNREFLILRHVLVSWDLTIINNQANSHKILTIKYNGRIIWIARSLAVFAEQH